MPKVTFVNEKITADAQPGEDLRTVAKKNGVQLHSGPHKILNCMGFGMCQSCNVSVKSGAENCSSKGLLERLQKFNLINPLLAVKMLSNPDKDVRLACQTQLNGDGDVEVESHPPINWHGEKFWN